jgi:hypothetical protein
LGFRDVSEQNQPRFLDGFLKIEGIARETLDGDLDQSAKILTEPTRVIGRSRIVIEEMDSPFPF